MIKLTNKITFSLNRKPIIIAEISGNHCGSKSKFLKLVESACLNGADLIKIQTYEPQDITLNKNYGNFLIKKGIWKGKKLWDLYRDACTPFSWHKDAYDTAKKFKKEIFSSPFSIRAVDLLESLKTKMYKIASFEITDHKLIDYIASKKKPIIISTGMASLVEIKKAIKIINKYHSKIIIMHCVSSYPTKLKDINLKKIDYLKKKFPKYLIGLSDHTNHIYSSIAATMSGVVAIEKHFKLNGKTASPDATFSITPKQLFELKYSSSNIFNSLSKKSNQIEKISKKLRRSIFATQTINKNEKISKFNIDTLRPSIGLCASEYFNIMGKKVKKKISKGEPLYKKYLI